MIKIEETFELKLANGKVVKWDGTDGLNAAMRYVDSHPEDKVIAWRYPKYEIRIGMINLAL